MLNQQLQVQCRARWAGESFDNRMLEEDDEIDRYKLKFAALQAAALTPDQTTAFLHQQAR